MLEKIGKARAFVAIIALASLIRIWGINHGFPEVNRYFYETEEYPSLQIAMGFGTGDLNPHSFNKPSLYYYVLFFFYGIFYVAGRMAGAFGGVADFLRFYFLDTWVFYLIGRALSVLFGVASICVIYSTGRKFFDRKAALVASLMLAVTPMHIEFSQLALSDMLGLLLSVISVYYALSAYEEFDLKYVSLSALFAGFSMSAKYYYGFVILALLTSGILKLARERSFGIFYIKAAAAGTISFLSGFLIGTPFAAIDYKYFLASLFELEKAKAVSGIPFLEEKTVIPNWWLEHISQLAKDSALGTGLLIVSIAGAIYAFLRRRWKDIVLLSFIVFFYGFFSLSRWRWSPAYYLLPIIPYLVLLGSDLMVWLTSLLKANRRVLPVLAAVIIVPYFMLACANGNLGSKRDTKSLAKEWIEANIPAGSAILMDRIFVPQLSFTAEALKRNTESNLIGENKLLPMYRNIKSKNEYAYLRDEALTNYGVPYDIYLIEPEEVSGIGELKKRYGIEYVVISGQAKDIYLNIAPFNMHRDRMSDFYASVGKGCGLLKSFKPDRINTPGPEIDIYGVN